MSRWINPLKSEEVWKPHYPKRVRRTHETRLCVESEEPFEVPTGKDDKMLVKSFWNCRDERCCRGLVAKTEITNQERKLADP